MGNTSDKCADADICSGNMDQYLSVDAVPHISEAPAASSSSSNLEMKEIVSQVAKATEKAVERNRASGGNVDETEIKIAKYDEMCMIPFTLSFSYKDAFILCTEDDESEVKLFRDKLVAGISLPGNEKPKIVLFSEVSNSMGNMFHALEFALKRCTFVCLFITSKFIKDKWSEFSSETCLMEAITNPERKWSVVPIRKSSENVDMPMIIRTLKGVRYDPSDRMYINMMENLFRDRLSVRKAKERAHKKELIEWMQTYEREALKQEVEMKKRLLEEKEKMEELHKQNTSLDHSLSVPSRLSCSETGHQNKVSDAVPLHHSTSCPSSNNPVKKEVMREFIRNVGQSEEKMDDKENSSELPSNFSSPVDDISYTSMPDESGICKDGNPIPNPIMQQVIHHHYYKTTNVNATTVQMGNTNVIKNINEPMKEDDTSKSMDLDEEDILDDDDEEEYDMDPLGVGEATNIKIGNSNFT